MTPCGRSTTLLIVPKTSSSWHQFLEGLFEVAQSALNLASCVVTRTTEILGQYQVCGAWCEGSRKTVKKIDANLDLLQHTSWFLDLIIESLCPTSLIARY